MYMEDIRARIDAMQDEMISTIREIVAVPSVGGDAEPGAPFGKGPRAALAKFVEIGDRLGMKTGIFEDQAGWADMGSPDDEMIAVLAHVDVVPPGEGWSCDPWEGMIKDGYLYGRGVADNKGQAVCAMYALKAIREAGITLKRRVRVLVGTNEEMGSKAIHHYVESGQELPVAGFTPDAEYPLINGEKGSITPTCRAPFAPDGGSVQVMSIDAGVAANAVPSRAVAVLKVAPCAKARLDRVVADFAAPRDAKLTCEALGNDEWKLTMEGMSFHGSQPQFGSNAAAHLVQLLRLLGIGGEQGAFLDKIDALVGTQTRGENLGVCLYDDISGFTSLCWGILKTEGDKVVFTLNYRFPVTFTLEPVREAFISKLTSEGFEVSNTRGANPLYVPEDAPIVQKLMKAYFDETGRSGEKPMSIGGGTYAKAMPNILAFGTTLPGENTHIHEIDERWKIENIVLSTKIMAAAILSLAEVKE
ncbi:MAG: Sapep family Mn(2+)-dependent dipeptidase [Pyramidobacter sp.]|nr:Sapep family Mn(2+)-dependent dipeptidase [Pyramidobacter sp.]